MFILFVNIFRLYSNATVKGEHYITPTWDMFYEKFGWMLNFWNIAGVPYLYIYQTYYILKNQTSVTESHNDVQIVAIYVLLIVAYYIFDSANCQKASYKIRGIKRATFPQVPWGILPDPVKVLKTPRGNLLIDGWYKYARKMQYTGDILMALSWGLICGYSSPLPYFYLMFFTLMILHRQSRDEVRCKEKYGVYWDEYTKLVPNIFIPDSRIITDFYAYLFSSDNQIGNKKKN
jgi:delta24(24(1))-sterol reductase